MAIGELYNNPHEWRPMIEERLVEYMRIHISHVGGFTAARRIAALAENFEVKTGWHGAGASPVGQLARVTLDMTLPNFGIHEIFGDVGRNSEIYQGLYEVKNGYAYVNEKPGWGMEIDEVAIQKRPLPREAGRENRLLDGALYLGVP